MKKFLLILIILNFLYGCGSVGDGFKLKKSNTGDEFLVEKKNPLVLPPNFNELPEPGKLETIEKADQPSFKVKIKENNNSINEGTKSSNLESTEEFILKNIKKNDTN